MSTLPEHSLAATMKCFLSSADFFFKINFFENYFQEYHQSVKKAWTQIRPEVLSGLIWVKTVCKGYHQMTLVSISPPHKREFNVNFTILQADLTLRFSVVFKRTLFRKMGEFLPHEKTSGHFDAVDFRKIFTNS